MNIKKEQSIMQFISKLTAAIGGNSFQVVDHWDSDLCAVGIAAPDDPDRLVYVSTY